MQKQHGQTLFIILLLCSAILLLRLFWTYVSAMVLALLIASVFYPAYARLKGSLRGRRNSAALLMCGFILLGLIIPTGWFIGTLSNEAFNFYQRTSTAVSLEKIQNTLESDSPWVKRIKGWSKILGLDLKADKVKQIAVSIGKKIGLFLYRQLSSIASNILNLMVHFFLMMLVIYYLFRDAASLKDYLIQLLPIPGQQLEEVINKFREMGKAIILGNGFAGAVQGFFGGLGFFIFGLEAPFLWGTMIAFMAFMPIVGASIVFVPVTALMIIQGETGKALAYLIYNLVYSSIVEYLLKPRLIGKSMRMNSLLVFIGIVGGIKLFGILGIIYGPLTITIFLALAEIYRLEYRDEPI